MLFPFIAHIAPLNNRATGQTPATAGPQSAMSPLKTRRTDCGNFLKADPNNKVTKFPREASSTQTGAPIFVRTPFTTVPAVNKRLAKTELIPLAATT
jgi:hypothetical protein